MEQIKKYLSDLNALSVICKDEDALTEYVICMKRLLNGLAQMHFSQLHMYEKLILLQPIEVFMDEFIEQINLAIQTKSTKDKKIIIKDIEDSMCEIINVYKNVVDSTANSDRQIFLSKAVNTNMYDLSPKICAFYSGILAKIVHMFDKNNNQYAFILHPTMKNNTEACLLFRYRVNPGKVVIIYIPENAIEEFDILPIHLLHEAFHVITRDERNRLLRAQCYLQHMMLGISQQLLYDISYDGEPEKKSIIDKLKLEETLVRSWMNGAKGILKAINEEEMNSKMLYSKNLCQYVLKELRDLLIKIDNDIKKDIEGICCKDSIQYSEYERTRKIAVKIAKKIHANLFELLCNDNLQHLSDLFMSAYREAYADIACILTLRITPDLYCATFERSIHFKYEENYSDMERNLRTFIVAKTIAKQLQDKEWENAAETLRKKLISHKIHTISDRHLSPVYVKICITPAIIDIYETYFNNCSASFSNRLNSIHGIDDFRTNILQLMKKNQEEILFDVLSGQWYNMFNQKNGGDKIDNND